MTIFAFVDVETTGLDPKKNLVLEVGWQLADSRLQPLGPGRAFIVRHGWWKLSTAYRQIDANPYVRGMHEESGLYYDIAGDTRTSMRRILLEFARDVARYRKPTDSVHFAGYSVSFDREFLRHNGWRDLIETDKLGFQMHHRLLDVSSMLMAYGTAEAPTPTAPNDYPHRALPDALNALDVAQMIRSDLTTLSY